MRGHLVAAGLVLVAALASTSAAATGDGVTMKVERYYDPGSRSTRLRFSGTVASGAANEYVAIVAQQCGTTFSTSVAGTTTEQGGLWHTEMSPVGSATYRARWNSRLSEPFAYRSPLLIWLVSRRAGRYLYGVSTGQTPQNMNGRFAELQRLRGGRWTLLRRVRLAAAGSEGSGTRYWAKFTVQTRRVTLRLAIPRKSAAPCFDETVSKSWVS